jgi:hypothetical protein
MRQFMMVMILLATLNVAHARPIADIEMPEQLPYPESSWPLTGMGVRNKLIIKLYAAGLYVPQAAAVNLQPEYAKAIRLHILSKMITRDNLRDAIHEGFVKSTNNHLASMQTQIKMFLSVFQDDVHQQDVFDLVYLPDQGVRVYKNQQLKMTLQGGAFQQALFGIWLSDAPVQDSLKNELLTPLPAIKTSAKPAVAK